MEHSFCLNQLKPAKHKQKPPHLQRLSGDGDSDGKADTHNIR